MNENHNPSNIDELGKQTEKEIFEIPACLKRAMDQKKLISEISRNIVNREVQHIYLIGAGSSYHAGFAISYMFNRITKIPTFTEYSMEFQYMIKPILKKEDCVIALSQSGETLDTIESAKIAKAFGCLTIGIMNDMNTTLARTCDHSISLECGIENSVLATKTYVTELAMLSMLALEIANEKKTIPSKENNEIWIELIRISDKLHSILPQLHESIKKIVQYFKFAEFCFILGSGPDYATALEAALKLKEGARIFSQAYSTAEFPHGPITLADSKSCILAIIPHEEDKRKLNLINLLSRIKERKATIFGIYEVMQNEKEPTNIDFGIQVPNTIMDLQPLIMIIAVQLLTLEISRMNGINCDTPKFLTKISGI